MLPRLWLLVGSDRQTDRPTMSLIELSWTAKNVEKQNAGYFERVANVDRKTAAPVNAKYIQRVSPAAYSWKATVNSGFMKSHRGKITIWIQGGFFAPCSVHFLFAFCFFLDFCLFWKYGICCWLLASPWRTSAINLDRQDIFQSWAKIQLQSLGGGNAFI